MGVSRQIINYAVVLLQHPINSDVVILNDPKQAELIKLFPLAAVDADPLEQTADRIL